MDDPRLGTLITVNSKQDKHDCTLIGFPNDFGCTANGGRAGARDGPTEVFKILPKIGTVINPELDIDISHLSIGHAGLIYTHRDLQDTVAQVSQMSIPIIIGGSNDQSFPNALGLLQNYPKLDVINIDAHLDVRPGKGHSGSPFQELLNNTNFNGKFTEFACQGNQCSAQHVEWAKSRGTEFHWLKDVKKNTFPTILESRPNPLFVSFDIDSIRASDCPGVSCPGTRGLTADQALDICFQAGKSPRVVGFDLSEFNPIVENNLTPRLVAQMVYYFLLGFGGRKSS
jgi:formiminoglutamase